MRAFAPIAVLALLVVCIPIAPATATSVGTTARVSVASDGTQGNGDSRADSGSDTSPPTLSADGRFVAFSSEASNLVPGDTNNDRDIFVHDRQSGITTRVSVASGGQQLDSETSFPSEAAIWPSISGDGKLVAFSSELSTVVAGDTNGASDIFVHDRPSGTTTRVSVASDGSQASSTGLGSFEPSISADGRYVAFESDSPNLVANDVNAATDVFVHDRQTGATTRASVSSQGTQAASGGYQPDISGDGRFVTFTSRSPDLVVGDVHVDREDVFVHDRQTGATTLVSVNSDGQQALRQSGDPSISGDGRFVAFESLAPLVPDDTNGDFDVYRHDRQTGTTIRASVASDGSQWAGGQPFGPDISGDGRHVVFVAQAANLDGGGIVVHDGETRTTTQHSVASDGTPPNRTNAVDIPAISADGRNVAFGSLATNLVPGDTNDKWDMFVHSPRPPASVSVGDVAVAEGDAGTRAAVFTVSLSAPAATTVTVAYATATGTATGGDFGAKAGTLSFAPGTAAATVKVPITGDVADEADESFGLTLSSPTGATLGDAAGVGTVVDDDPPAVTGRRLAIGDVSVHEGDAGARAAVFTVSLSKASTSWVWVAFATAKGTAIGTDFTAKTGSLGFAPGSTSLTVKVAVTPDTVVESDEAFSVKLSNADRATITDAVGVGTIIDND